MEEYNIGKEQFMPTFGEYAMQAMPIVIMYVPMMIPPLGLPGGMYRGNNFSGGGFSGRNDPYLERTRDGNYTLNKSALDALLDTYSKAEDKKDFNPEEALPEQ